MDKHQDNTGDAWLQERFGRTAPPRRAVYWYAGSLLLAMGLLVSFYMVLTQAVSRAHQHWSTAGGSQVASRDDACNTSRQRDACVASVGSAGMRSAAGLIGTGR